MSLCFATSQFRFLRRLLFVHGAWNHTRVSKLIMYTFHKNVCLYLIGLWYAMYSGWSGQTLFERWTMAAYNLLFTGAPSIAIGLLDKTGSAETMMNFPELYRISQREIRFSKKTFWMWISKSVYHSVSIVRARRISGQISIIHNDDDGDANEHALLFIIRPVCRFPEFLFNTSCHSSHLNTSRSWCSSTFRSLLCHKTSLGVTARTAATSCLEICATRSSLSRSV